LVIGGGAILLGRDPNGLANYLFTGTRLALARVPVLARLSQLPERSTGRQDIEQAQVVSHGTA
jgi:hypothetical protein